MKRRLLGVLLAVAMVGTLAAGCGSKSTESEKKTEDKKVIKIAGTAVSEVFYEAFKDKYEAEGYKTEFVSFDSNPVCLEGLCQRGNGCVAWSAEEICFKL